MSGLAYTKAAVATSKAQMILGRDGNRLELTIYNLSDTEFVFIGMGSEIDEFSIKNTLPLAPGEAYDASVPPLSAIFLVTNGPDVETVVYYSTTAPAYVRGTLGGASV